jgi:hypothetical protein
MWADELESCEGFALTSQNCPNERLWQMSGYRPPSGLPKKKHTRSTGRHLSGLKEISVAHLSLHHDHPVAFALPAYLSDPPADACWLCIVPPRRLSDDTTSFERQPVLVDRNAVQLPASPALFHLSSMYLNGRCASVQKELYESIRTFSSNLVQRPNRRHKPGVLPKAADPKEEMEVRDQIYRKLWLQDGDVVSS